LRKHLTESAGTAPNQHFGCGISVIDFQPMAMTTLREIVERYREFASGFGELVPLSSFGLSPEETERVFNGLDEDYHISRFFRFSKSQGTEYIISGNSVTHLAIEEAVLSIL
jgi:hypothetical protein